MRKLKRFADCPFGTRIYHGEITDKGGFVVRNDSDSPCVVVEQDGGQLTTYNNNEMTYVKE